MASRGSAHKLKCCPSTPMASMAVGPRSSGTVPAHSCVAVMALPLPKLLLAMGSDPVPAWHRHDDWRSVLAHRALVGEMRRSWACPCELRKSHGKTACLYRASSDIPAAPLAPACVLVCHSEPIPSHLNSKCEVVAHGGSAMTVERAHEHAPQVWPVKVMSCQALKNLAGILALSLAKRSRLLALLLELPDDVHGQLIAYALAVRLSIQPRCIQPC
mmetsp:Transcript_76253/g.223541  ORF Transcript_76253/g.223541 Transcript_76253/m.223541 type:complete len:216 (-) Transcript_76253:60-707(-)